jgi:hypothetical protein
MFRAFFRFGGRFVRFVEKIVDGGHASQTPRDKRKDPQMAQERLPDIDETNTPTIRLD